jgi:molybdenum cofactor guanylyltransferase
MPRSKLARPTSWHGVLLAGGTSRRFGSDKVFARVGERRLIDLARLSLAGADGVSVLLGSPARATAVASLLPAGLHALPDDVPGRGPMGGLATALARRGEGWVAALATDVPLVPPEWWPWLARHHRPGTIAVAARDRSGRWEPLAALYHGTAGRELQERVTAGYEAGLALHAWLDALQHDGRVTIVDPSGMPRHALLNVNRPEDAAELERLLADAAGGATGAAGGAAVGSDSPRGGNPG